MKNLGKVVNESLHNIVAVVESLAAEGLYNKAMVNARFAEQDFCR